MKARIILIAFFTTCMFGLSQAQVKMSYEKFQTWANSAPVKDYMVIETENLSNVMSVVLYKPDEKKTLTVLSSFMERFNDYKMFDEYAAAEVYELNGHRAVYYFSKSSSFLNVEFVDWNLSTTWMTNKLISKEELEGLYLESGFDKIIIEQQKND